jgi:hypothetical protein
VTAPRRRWRGSLAARIALVFLVLLLAVQLASFAALRLSWTSHRRGELPRRLETGSKLLQTLLDQRVEAAIEVGRATAKDNAIRGTLFDTEVDETTKRRTIVSAFGSLKERAKASDVAFLDMGGAVLYRTEPVIRDDLAAIATYLRSKALVSGSARELMPVDGKPYQLVLVPELAPVLRGWILLAIPLDDTFKGDMKRLSEFDVTVLARTGPRAPWTIASTTLAPAFAADLADQPWGADAAAQAMVAVPTQGDELGVHATMMGGAGRPPTTIPFLVSE